MSGRASAYVLELEAADYFKLDVNQVLGLSQHIVAAEKNEKSAPSRCAQKSLEKKPIAGAVTRTKSTDTSGLSRQTVGCSRTLKSAKATMTTSPTTNTTNSMAGNKKKKTVETQTGRDLLFGMMTGSRSSGSLQSLPSISSSASVSPTLVCPHLSLDDIINRQHALASPHTIGLCKKCRLEPPPNVQSPLSPVFKPHSVRQSQVRRGFEDGAGGGGGRQPLGARMLMKRRHSDHEAHQAPAGATRRHTQLLTSYYGDESLDYWLEPRDLERLKLSPSLRNSVEFIRSNPTESGRVLRIYKNGQPYEKPLRVCILRGEFMSLAHLLDHINGRTIIPHGARYLFHLAGQLVYSENELKHNSIYIVSGTRNFNFRANAIIEAAEQRRKKPHTTNRPQEQQVASLRLVCVHREPEVSIVAPANMSHQQTTGKASKCAKKQPHSTTLAHQPPVEPPPIPSKLREVEQLQSLALKSASAPAPVPVRAEPVTSGAQNEPPKEAKIEAQVETCSSNKMKPPIAVPRKQRQMPNANSKPTTSETLPLKPPKIARRNPLNTRNNNNKHNASKPDCLSKSNENLKVIADCSPVKKAKSIVRAKSELADSNGKRKKNVTFVEPDSAKPGLPKKVNASRKVKQPTPKKKTTTLADSHKPEAPPPPSSEVNKEAKKSMEEEPGELMKEEEAGDIRAESSGVADELANEASEAPSMEEMKEEPGPVKSKEPVKGDWQYPGGRKHNITPEERPISQMEADETTSRSKVVTPSPSLSLTGDSLRQSISLDEQRGDTQHQPVTPRQMRPVLGKPCSGTQLPENNFKLIWVNGININDGASISEETQQQAALLSPQSAQQLPLLPQFKPKDTFHNWLCYSSRYDELVYPSGCLVVLWWIARDEQRYYSGHTLNVTALALCSHDKEVGASAQAGGSSCVHLWTLARLETLRIVEDTQLVDLHLFSMSVRNSPEDGCELVVGGNANKRLKVVAFFLDLRPNSPAATTAASSSSSKMDGVNKGGRVSRRARRASLSKAESTLNASKPLKSNQLPLSIMLASSVRGRLPGGHSEPLDDVVVSVGQHHFQAWFMDRKQRNFKPIESRPLGSVKVKDISDSLSCFARLAAGEILVGTNQGAINLIRIKCRAESSGKSGAPAATTTNRNELNSQVCELELISLHQLDNCYAITSLSRVSRNTFVSCDAGLHIRLWKIEQSKSTQTDILQKGSIVCQLLDTLKIPSDLGFICSLVPTNRLKREPVLELILVSSRNVFISANMLINEPNSGSINVIYDGHESPVTGLVSDRLSLSSTALQADYFTCALDCNICRWNGKMLVWKSILPSACACLAVHPTGFVLAVGSTDGTVYILDKVSGLLVSYFPLTPVCINCLAYSRDGALLASGCSNGSIFILPVYERGLKYKKVSIFQSPHPVVSLQFSLDNKYILTSVTQGAYQELVLWDLPNFRYMCQNVRGTVDKIQWFDSICSGSEDVRAIWENKNLTASAAGGNNSQSNRARSSESIKLVVNLSCHRLVRQPQAKSRQQQSGAIEHSSSTPRLQDLAIACDTMGHLRLFQYPCYDNRQGFYEARVTSSAVNCCRFLQPKNRSTSHEVRFVSTSLVGSIFLWTTC